METSTHNPWVAHGPLIGWSLLVAFLLLVPGSAVAAEPDWLERFGAAGGDKLIHALLFFAQAAVLTRSGRRLGWVDERGWLAALAAIGYGFFLEVAQEAIPGRGWEAADLGADAVGALLWPLTPVRRRG